MRRRRGHADLLGLAAAAKPYAAVITAVLIALAAVVGLYLRLLPLFNVAPIAARFPEAKLNEMDPFGNYWLIKYLDEHGPGAWFRLTNDNPDTHIFWYPLGRDFTKELPGLIFTGYLLYQLVKPFGIDLLTLLAVLPPIFGALTVVGSALLAYEVSGKKLAAVLAAWLVALSFIDRTLAGFFVKYSLGIALAPFVLWLHIRAWRRGSIKLALLTGLVLTYFALSWRGYNLVFAPIAVVVLLHPLMVRRFEPKLIGLWAAEVLPLTAVLIPVPAYGVRYVFRSVGILAPASLALLLLYLGIERLLPPLKAKIAYLGLLVGVAALGAYSVYVARIIAIGGKAALAIGIRVPGLPETIAQYQPAAIGLFGPSSYILWLGIVALFFYVPIAIYRLIVSKDPWHLALAIIVGLSVWATRNIAYFTSMTTTVILTTFSILLAEVAYLALPERRRSRWYYGRRLSFGLRQVGAALLFIALLTMHVGLYILNAGVVGRASADIVSLYRSQYTTIASSELGSVPAPSWLGALHFLRNSTPPGSLVVAWWDYGYWISVVAQRPSVADGATINETHIRILAIALSAPEKESACTVLRYLGGEEAPEIYLVAHAMVLAIKRNRTVEFEPLIQGADPAKALSAILRLARLGLESRVINKSIPVPDPNRIVESARFGERLVPLAIRWGDPSVRNSTIFRVFINGTYEAMGSVFPNHTIRLVYPLLYISPAIGKESAAPLNTTLYKPVKMFISRFAHGRLRDGSEYYEFEIVYVFKLDKAAAERVCSTWDP